MADQMTDKVTITRLDRIKHPMIDTFLACQFWMGLGLSTNGKKEVIVYEDMYGNIVLEAR
jgi:hypothetical protein